MICFGTNRILFFNFMVEQQAFLSLLPILEHPKLGENGIAFIVIWNIIYAL